jgi:hypothetical protein
MWHTIAIIAFLPLQETRCSPFLASLRGAKATKRSRSAERDWREIASRASPRAAHRADPWARNDRVCRIDRFIQAGSVINSQRLCHLGVTIEAHNGKAGGRAKPSPIESFDLLFPCRLPAEPDGCRRKRVLSLCYSEFFGNEGNEFRAGWQFFSLSLPA